MNHRYPRTERDLRWLAVNFSAGTIVRALPERLECLAAWHRVTLEAEKASNGQPHTFDVADREYAAAIQKLRAAGVEESMGEFTFSPACGPDAPRVP